MQCKGGVNGGGKLTCLDEDEVLLVQVVLPQVDAVLLSGGVSGQSVRGALLVLLLLVQSRCND